MTGSPCYRFQLTPLHVEPAVKPGEIDSLCPGGPKFPEMCGGLCGRSHEPGLRRRKTGRILGVTYKVRDQMSGAERRADC